MNTTLRTIRVRGTLAKLLKRRTFKAAVRSPQEAIRFLLANYPELEGYMRPRFFHISVGGRVINEESIGLPAGLYEDINITPAICGAGGPVGQVITGLALITLSIFVPFVAPVLLPLGIGLTLTGVAGLLSPVTPDRPESSDARDSYSFNGLQQTSREGPPVPLVYGEIITGSIVLSVKIERDDEKLGTGDGEGIFEAGPDSAQFPNPDPKGCFQIVQVVDWGIRPECVDYYIQYQPIGIRTSVFNEQFISISSAPISVGYSAPPSYFICQNQGTFGVLATFNVIECGSDNQTTDAFQAAAVGGQNYPASITYYKRYADGSTVLLVQLNYNVDYYGVYGPP